MRPIALAVLGSLLAATSAIADVDVDTGGAALKTKSTIAPAGEIEVYRFDATTGARLTFALNNAHGAHLAFAPTLYDPGDAAVPIGTSLKTTAKGVSLKNYVLPASGSYRLEVTSAVAGEFTLSLKAVPQTKYVYAPSSIANGVPATFSFAAPPGSSLTMVAKAVKSDAAPVFGVLQGTDYALSLASAGSVTPHSHAVSVPSVGGTGDLSVEVSNAGATGDVAVQVVVHPPRHKPVRFDLRSIKLGRPKGGETFVVREIDDTGGVVAVADGSSDLFGAAVSIPAGALEGSLPISIGSSPALVLTDPDDQAAGFAVDLQPSGTTFKSAATVTLPFDFSLLPANQSPSDIRVLIREDDGSTRIVIPLAVDEVAGTVTLQTSGFSVCVPIVRTGIPRFGLTPGGDEYWALFLEDQMDDQPSTNDSRGRQYTVQVGEVALFADSSLQFNFDHRTFRVDNSDDGNGNVNGSVTATQQFDSGTATWNYEGDGQSIFVTTGDTDRPTFRVARDGSAMVGHGRTPASGRVDCLVLLRKDKDPIALADLKGTYSLIAVDIDPQNGGGGPGSIAYAQPDRVFGQATFDGAGGLRISATQVKSRFDSSTNSWSSRQESIGLSSTYRLDKDGTILLDIPPEKPGDNGDTFRLMPGTGLDALMGTHLSAANSNVFAIWLVKQGSGFSTKTFTGPYRMATIEVGARTYDLFLQQNQFVVPDLELRDAELSTTFDGTSPVKLSESGHEVFRDPSVAGGLRIQTSSDSFDVNVSVDAKGTFRLSSVTGEGGVQGAVTPDAMFGFFVKDLRELDGGHMLGFCVKVPPATPQ
jgi:hypothetical protein